MASHEIESEGLCVIVSDGSHRNQMFSNRIRRSLASVETPAIFGSLSRQDIVKMVNEVLTSRAYMEAANCRTKHGMRRYYSGRIYFNCKEDAMAFKLRWS